jgi:hypothetical protein
VDGITRILNQPLTASTSYIPGSQQPPKLTSEMIILFWEMSQCNKRFRSFIIDTGRSHDFLVLILFYAIEHKLDASKQGVVRMCVFLLQTLSVEPNFGKNLNKKFEAQETLPLSIRLQNFNGTYADFLIHVSQDYPRRTYQCYLPFCRQSITSSRRVRGSSQQSTQHYWLSSTISPLTSKISALQHPRNSFNFSPLCHRLDFYYQMIPTTTYYRHSWKA